MKIKKFPFVQQLDAADCGLTCLRIISKYYGVNIDVDNKIFSESNLTRQGLLLSELEKVSSRIGYENLFVELDFDQIKDNVILPAIFYWNNNHFIVVYKIKKEKVYVSDPAVGRLIYNKKQFLEGWKGNGKKGVILLLKPTKNLAVHHKTEKNRRRKSLFLVLKNLRDYKMQVYLLVLILLLSSLTEFFFPFFTQKIIDKGVRFKNVSFLYLILSAQIVLFISKVTNEFYRTWLFINISSRLSLDLVSGFLMKLMDLPVIFFYSKTIGDLLERIDDHKRIEKFLTDDLLKSIFALFSLIVFGLILLYFSTPVFYIFIIGNTLQLTWIFIFLDRIKTLDKIKFKLSGKEYSKNIELLTGMQEIKLNNLENLKRKEWEKIQLELFNVNTKNIKLNQRYESYRFITFLTSLLITFTCALSVINNTLSIGTMMSIVFIIGAVNAPISQILNCILSFQLLMVSLTRVDEINNLSGESAGCSKSKVFNNGDLEIIDVSFSYNGITNVLDNINLKIEKGSTTAIVGLSGSGKTTLIKLLLKFYNPNKGLINLDNISIQHIDDAAWRSRCGVIFQDSFIFSNSIAFNICLSENYDQNKLILAVKNANIQSFIEELPMKYETIIGQEGIGISQGQRQRILIARAIYKDPDYLFFDEATNSLDSENEKAIVNNLEKYFKGKTMVIVAHRLSTVMNADQIIVLEKAKIVEKGTHTELIHLKGKYFNLVKNQLELGN
ncbi:peptidase domain-containing ABC transporter [Flavobacterium sp. ANB]|uniref:peptidase domain-containing ABC transporter n=1 Tax=unclassified Flavobacterium TaxID=196869 RepID=UPI0012B8664E|nr:MULTISPECIES: peptidase domain-containing ABC transporter [unclassified Flavobacterium]MBF4519159.1 peptidase domain-containing ABC transporter [Flavobacterium sp. ANB]MTD71641.1 ATP-binding cassette domain-containing protein [Flavobacterium sp. LC2016-13]